MRSLRLRYAAISFQESRRIECGERLLEVTLRVDSLGTAYAGTWTAASYDLGAGPLGSGGPPQPNSEYQGTLQAVKIPMQ